MVRSSKATSYTFAATSHFDDAGSYAPQYSETRINPHSRPVVSYFFPKGVGEYHFGATHPMKPHRLTLTNSLVIGYGLDKKIHHFVNSTPATRSELEAYHTPSYISTLESKTLQQTDGTIIGLAQGDNRNLDKEILENLMRMDDMTNDQVDDCPVFGGMYEFFKQYAGGSLAGARSLVGGKTDIAVNWSGGLHHAKKAAASGFCYINDIVLAILELLRYYPRVMYIDIDIHHGDGVEQAFYHSNRVFTVSFHKYSLPHFFPGTGKWSDDGMGEGKNFCINIPLSDGIDDESYTTLFRETIDSIVTAFQPSVIVLQCGADSLGCDKLGAFNLSIKGHGDCVRFVKNFNIPLLVLGGGGYTIHNVSRCWTYETSVLLNVDIPNELPTGPFLSYFYPDFLLHPPIVQKVENENSAALLKGMINGVRQKMRYLQGAPSVCMEEFPPGLLEWLEKEAKRSEERDKVEKEGDTEKEKDTRPEDRHFATTEFFEGELDNKGEGSGVVENETPTGDDDGKGGVRRGGTRRGAGRKPRGRGGRVTFQEPEDVEMEDGATATAKRRPSIRGGRGRGRGRQRTVSSSPASDHMSE